MGAVHSRAVAGQRAARSPASSGPRPTGAAARGRRPRRRAYADLDALLGDPAVDGRPRLHAEPPARRGGPGRAARRQARRVREAARHDARPTPRAMEAEAGAAGVVATVPFVYRFHPMVREARARIARRRRSGAVTPRPRRLPPGLAGPSRRRQLAGRPRASAARPAPSATSARTGATSLEFVTGDRITAAVAPGSSPPSPERGGRRPVATEDIATRPFETAGRRGRHRGHEPGVARAARTASPSRSPAPRARSPSTRRSPSGCGSARARPTRSCCATRDGSARRRAATRRSRPATRRATRTASTDFVADTAAAIARRDGRRAADLRRRPPARSGRPSSTRPCSAVRRRADGAGGGRPSRCRGGGQ